MSGKLWFVTDGVNLIGVFKDREKAEKEKERYQDDPDYDYFDHYGIETRFLEDYPEEYDYALQKGLLE